MSVVVDTLPVVRKSYTVSDTKLVKHGKNSYYLLLIWGAFYPKFSIMTPENRFILFLVNISLLAFHGVLYCISYISRYTLCVSRKNSIGGVCALSREKKKTRAFQTSARS